VRERGPAPIAELVKLNLAGNELLVFGRPIIDPLALRALQFN
jgi:hypothetical protein